MAKALLKRLSPKAVFVGGELSQVTLTLLHIQLDYPAATQFPRRFLRHPSSISKVTLYRYALEVTGVAD